VHNAVAIFHGDVTDVTCLLEPKIPNVAKSFLDNIAIRGPTSHCETLEGNRDDAIKEWERRQFGQAIVSVAATRIAKGTHKFYILYTKSPA
jgi:hypothetical protein